MAHKPDIFPIQEQCLEVSVTDERCCALMKSGFWIIKRSILVVKRKDFYERKEDFSTGTAQVG